MSAIALLGGVLLAQAAAPAITVEGGTDRSDVAYEQLAAGRPAEAVERIRGNRQLEPGDPAKLINLGTAYARLGQRDKAIDRYTAAIASKERYDLQLADGSWMDSRRAARLAIAMLARQQLLSLR
jgi:tetratricopeptide (TPR) repeat protein